MLRILASPAATLDDRIHQRAPFRLEVERIDPLRRRLYFARIEGADLGGEGSELGHLHPPADARRGGPWPRCLRSSSVSSFLPIFPSMIFVGSNILNPTGRNTDGPRFSHVNHSRLIMMIMLVRFLRPFTGRSSTTT